MLKLLTEKKFLTKLSKKGKKNGSALVLLVPGAGLGYLGEDIASLIVDETGTDCLHKYYPRLITAYYRGTLQYLDFPIPENNCIWENDSD